MNSKAVTALIEALKSDRPAVLVLGQDYADDPDRLGAVATAFNDRLGNSSAGSSWLKLLAGRPATGEDFEWLSERFARTLPSPAMERVFDIAWSAVFTSSIDKGIARRFETRGRIPETVLAGDHYARTARSKSRPPVHFLFGVVTETSPSFKPPSNPIELKRRIALHANPLLNRIPQSATPLGVVVIDGLKPGSDWLELDQVLTPLSVRPGPAVLLFGPCPDEASVFLSSLEQEGVLYRDERPLAIALAAAEVPRELDESVFHVDPGTVSLANGKYLQLAPSLRLRVEAAAAIVDDSWTELPEYQDAIDVNQAFHRFHGDFGGPRATIEGVLRGFAIARAFESKLLAATETALKRLGDIESLIVLHGQSGVGKSIALARLAIQLRNKFRLPILYGWSRVPFAIELDDFCKEAEAAGAPATVLLCDGNHQYEQYAELVEGLKSRGRRVVVVGTSYRLEEIPVGADWRFVEAPELLSDREIKALRDLLRQYAVEPAEVDVRAPENHFLALLYRYISATRSRLAGGVAGEARAAAAAIRGRAANVPPPTAPQTLLAEKLLQAGLGTSGAALFDDLSAPGEGNDAAGRLIDLVMAAGRLDCPVPVNLLLRALRSSSDQFDFNQIGHLFRQLDLFRWKAGDKEGNVLLIQPRIQLEAELICRKRLAGSEREADCLIDLLTAVRSSNVDARVEIQFAIDLLHKLHHDGPRGKAYQDGYLRIARALTTLREQHQVLDSSLMLQESTFRREAVYASDEPGNLTPLAPQDRSKILDEAREVLEQALAMIREGRLSAGRRARQNFAVERASIYAYLAVGMAKRGEPEDVFWPHYLAARTAITQAASVAMNTYPLDVGIWTPGDIIDIGGASGNLSEARKAELQADILSMLDLVNTEVLTPRAAERFQSRRIKAADWVSDINLKEDAYKELEAINPALALYLKARSLAPSVFPPPGNDDAPPSRQEALKAIQLLEEHRAVVFNDQRCLGLLLRLRWVAETGVRIFQKERCPVPTDRQVQLELLEIVSRLNAISGDTARNAFRMLHAALEWIAGDSLHAEELFLQLSRDTNFEDSSRVLRRLVLEPARGARFEGRMLRRRTEGHWEVRVAGFDRKVDLLEREFPLEDFANGREITTPFHIAFNYLGPIADPLQRGGRS